MSDLSSYSKHFSEPKLWRVLTKVGRPIVEPALSLWFVMMAPTTPTWVKTAIVAALGYLICPFDVLPDMIPVLGYTDDAAVLAAAVSGLAKHVTPKIRRQVAERV